MIDFIAYVVSELKSKRLSKANALDLIRQFSSAGSAPAGVRAHPGGSGGVLHPLLHRNTSDLEQQSYAATLTGSESFLEDHRVDGHKVLPGAAYLEMARAAVAAALPADRDPSGCEIRNVVWAQPVIVSGDREVSIALFREEAGGDGESGPEEDSRGATLGFEIYSVKPDGVEGKETVHCQGEAAFPGPSRPSRLDLDALTARMGKGVVAASEVYAAYRKMGLQFGPAHQALTQLHRGEREALARLRLPGAVKAGSGDYGLHPSLLDGAFQAVLGLLEDFQALPAGPSVPYALASLRILAPCAPEMAVWVRSSPGQRAGEALATLDFDLCDPQGNVCVQLRGFAARPMGSESRRAAPAGKAAPADEGVGAVFCAPAWEAPAASAPDLIDIARQQVLLCRFPQEHAGRLAALVPGSRCEALAAPEDGDIAACYRDAALACIGRIQSLFRDHAGSRILFQIAVARSPENDMLAGLSGLLKTAALENPDFTGQVILAEAHPTPESLAACLLENRERPKDAIVRYEQGARQVLSLRELAPDPGPPPVAFKEDGVYLITGGLGGLGLIFAREILTQTRKGRVILTGRAEVADRMDRMDRMGGLPDPGRAAYRKLDLENSGEVRGLVTGILAEYGRLDGILHSAGMVSDSFVLKKTSDRVAAVLAPKVAGIRHLDEAVKDVPLDFLALFSSAGSWTGNPGQADYAAANGFLDRFSAYRNLLAASGERRGRTVSINWPLWEEGGLTVGKDVQEALRRATGMHPLRTATGLEAFHRCLAAGPSQVLILEGEPSRLRRTLFAPPDVTPTVPMGKHAPASGPAAGDREALEEKTRDFVRRELSALLKLPPHRIDPQEPMERYGIDSILAMNMTNRLEKTFGPLSKTLFFEHQTIHDLSRFLADAYPAVLAGLLAGPEAASPRPAPSAPAAVPEPFHPAAPAPGDSAVAAPTSASRRRRARFSAAGNGRPSPEAGHAQHAGHAGHTGHAGPIAVIGLSGRYPESEDIRAFWRNLSAGKDCIIEVPRERWDWREYLGADPAKGWSHASKWGGFISGVDEFDARFFNITPLEAEFMDPQERLFLQFAWMAMEDSGYTRPALQIPRGEGLPGQVGVYVGVMYGEYQLFGAEAGARGKRMGFAGNLANIANRVSYLLNLHGPSMTLDTMCSSSLTAIHLACQDLRQGSTDLAIAGGVNVSIHPNKYLMLSAGRFLSGDGHCQSFGEGGDGYIPGEGVGAVVLKRLPEAVRDGNPIYGIIRGSAINHGGKTNGYTVPNPRAQAGVIQAALSDARIDARQVSYVEAHGTGTKLGDPIEIAALAKAFGRPAGEGRCTIGSVKSNIGHCESAAGIAGLTKILLQMKHGLIAPSLHSARLNPNIDFAKTPFVVNQALGPWDRPRIAGREVPRLAGLSSFGAGGSNAHLLVEEHRPAAARPLPPRLDDDHIIPLSARTPEQLVQKARDLLAFLRDVEVSVPAAETAVAETAGAETAGVDLASLAYTLQAGREAMEERMGFLAGSVSELAAKLETFVAGGGEGPGIFRGNVEQGKDMLSALGADPDFQATLDAWIARRKSAKLIELWVKGLKLDWVRVHGETQPPFLSLPAYPFAKERHWVDTSAAGQAGQDGAPAAPGISALHPLMHANTSDLTRQSYRTTFTGAESFLADHQVGLDGSLRKVLPAAAYLEMARAAVAMALPAADAAVAAVAESGSVELRDVAWLRPILVAEPLSVTIALSAASDASFAAGEGGEEVEFEIVTEGEDGEILHCQGRALAGIPAAPDRLDLERIGSGLGDRREAADLYPVFSRLGLHYGPAHRSLVSLLRGGDQALARLRLPAEAEAGAAGYMLHPSLLDGALQAVLGLLEGPAGASSNPAPPALPFALESATLLAPTTAEMYAWVRPARAGAAEGGIRKVDIDLCDAEGKVCVRLAGLASREIVREIVRDIARDSEAGARPAEAAVLLATPVWKAAPEPETPVNPGATGPRHVLLCGMPRVDARQLGDLLPGFRCADLPPARTQQAQGNLPDTYGAAALAAFASLQALMREPLQAAALVQIVIPDMPAQLTFAGLSGLLKTAGLENPRVAGQILIADPDLAPAELAAWLREEQHRPQDACIRRRRGLRQVQRWEEIPAEAEAPASPFRPEGVYLITGGLGGLGLLFARDILREAPAARIILTGRAAEDEAMGARLRGLFPDAGGAGGIAYRRLDPADLAQVREALGAILAEHGRLDGILHSAGMSADNFILKKTEDEFRRVLAPKVAGAFNLDEAARDVRLDFLALFSSVAGAIGNVGQADYAAANGFLDAFAAYRGALVAEGSRFGRTVSFNWPLWQEGGMGVDAAVQGRLRKAYGLEPLGTAAGLRAFRRGLALGFPRVLVLEGETAKLRGLLAGPPADAAPDPAEARSARPASSRAPASAAAEMGGDLLAATVAFLRDEFASVLKMRPLEINPKTPLENYGIDSILAMKLTDRLEESFGPLSKTLFFEYQTVAALAGHLVAAHAETLRRKTAVPEPAREGAPARPQLPREPSASAASAPARRIAARSRNRFVGPRPQGSRDIAIIGVGGRYPQAETLEQFWENLKRGRDSITEIPAERWDSGLYFDPARNTAGRSYSKWGGFLADVDKFDPLFFNISPKEAALMDPQERLFLETAWQAIEDAGYSKEGLAAGRKVGVYVGVMYGHYELYGAEAIAAGNMQVPGSSHASIANRVSYYFDFSGPSIALDTMCSSSLTAIYLACEELSKGGIDAALAGGVNLSLHPHKYLVLSQGNFASSDGRCRSFGAGGDGYVPGEGVGAVLLKPLDRALADGDPVQAVIKSWAVNHGGKTNGYTVPNPNAQADMVLAALRQAGVDPRTLGYLETHGTGTSLGDPIEIAGLMQAFAPYAPDRQACAIGSVKSNIGHLESAAGIAAVTKVLLQLKHGQLAPSLHADPPNPNIDFPASPFYVQTRLEEWRRKDGQARRAGISSFGAGGANAHLILEEYAGTRAPAEPPSTGGPQAFLLSARDASTLRRYAERYVGFLETFPAVAFADLAYTSQTGRTAMGERLVILAADAGSLGAKLRAWLQRGPASGPAAVASEASEPDGIYHGNIRSPRSDLGALVEGQAGQAFLQAILENQDLAKLAKFWVSGVEVDWSALPRQGAPRRIPLPTYPFSRERHWIDVPTAAPGGARRAPPETEAVPPAPAVPPQRLHYRPRWQESPLQAVSGASVDGPILILDAADDFHQAVKNRLEGTPAADAVHLADPRRPDLFLELVESLGREGRPPRAILHRETSPKGLENTEDLARELEGGFYPLFLACQILMRQKHTQPVRLVSLAFSRGVAGSPQHAALGGFFKTLSLENPRFQATVVELMAHPEALSVSVEDQSKLALDELLRPAGKRCEVRYRILPLQPAPLRLEKDFVPFLPDGATADLPLRQQGVYLISGGLGGLGFLFAEYLAARFHARLVLFGRSAPDARQEEKLARLRGLGAETLYLQADAARREDIDRVVAGARERFSRIDGVIHAAGINRDGFILKKAIGDMRPVIEPKALGALHLDRATLGDRLDLFALFSSVAGALGNPGQGDYAFANNFLDAFAEARENLRQEGKRAGRTLSINWPFWAEGGMSLSAADIATAEKRSGVVPLPVAEGFRYWEEFLRSDLAQGMALFGDAARIAAFVSRAPARPDAPAPASADSDGPAADGVGPGALRAPLETRSALLEKTVAYLTGLVAAETKAAPDRIDPEERFEAFGIDSMMINRINLILERDLGELSKTLMYEYETVASLSAHLAQGAPGALLRLFGEAAPVPETETGVADAPAQPAAAPSEKEPEPVRAGPPARDSGNPDETDAIAIVGAHGIYPQARDLEAYWENLRAGRESVDLVPASRWDRDSFYDPDPAKAAEGKIYCKWGGFLDDVDRFDPAFFNIAPEEARIMDPQERLFLESVWGALEDAGYTRDGLKRLYPRGKSADVGVFVGVTTNSYNLLAAEEWSRGNMVSPGSMPWSIANRVSYLFDFQGPSMPIDTACSSSLVAIHLACESLKRRECRVAVAGGLNLHLHPSKYLSFCRKRMVSLDGKCRSFGALSPESPGADGFVPGEGVGALILKPLRQALADGDHVYAVIPGSGFGHAGRANGYSAPNPNSQAELISRTLEQSGIDPGTIGYIEGHGTGTGLGDSLEVAALTLAFRRKTDKRQYCALGSVKANIGHSESAAGIAGVTKVLLQMKHRHLVPTLHSEAANADIDFASSPFYLQHGLKPWESPAGGRPRRALINSLGAGGVNACVILEERAPSGRRKKAKETPQLFVVSARDEDRLREQARRLLGFLGKHGDLSLGDVAYTLQVGREAMPERLAVVAAGRGELLQALRDWVLGKAGAGIHRGHADLGRGRKPAAGEAGERPGLDADALSCLAEAWVRGAVIAWRDLHPDPGPARVSLPTYPFAGERHWISDGAAPRGAAPRGAAAAEETTRLHPLVSFNSSTLKEVSFSSILSEQAFYARDHVVRDMRLFPGSGFLEIACISGNIAGERKVHKLRDVVWVQPLAFSGPRAVQTVLKPDGNGAEFKIVSSEDGSLHSEGRLIFRDAGKPAAVSGEDGHLQALKEKCGDILDPSRLYAMFRESGFDYGPAFRTIQEFRLNGTSALARLKLADHLKADFEKYILHPSLVDGALQAVAGLLRGDGGAATYLPFAIDEVEILGPIPQSCYAHVQIVADGKRGGDIRKFDIRLLNDQGGVLMRIKNFYVRALAKASRAEEGNIRVRETVSA